MREEVKLLLTSGIILALLFTSFGCIGTDKHDKGDEDTSDIIIEGKYLGGLGFGQFFLEPPDMEFFSKQADEFGFDKEKYLKAVAEVPIISLEDVEQISKI